MQFAFMSANDRRMADAFGSSYRSPTFDRSEAFPQRQSDCRIETQRADEEEEQQKALVEDSTEPKQNKDKLSFHGSEAGLDTRAEQTDREERRCLQRRVPRVRKRKNVYQSTKADDAHIDNGCMHSKGRSGAKTRGFGR